MRWFGRFLGFSCATFMVAGCYHYTPVQTAERGMDVRAQLETEAAIRRSQGMNDPIMRYDGVVVDVTPDAVSLDVLIARSTSAFQDVEIRDTIQLRTTEIQAIMQRSISPWRTALFTIGTGVAAFAVVKSIDAVVGGTDDDDGNGPPPTLVVPVLTWTGFRLLPAFAGVATKNEGKRVPD